MPYRVDVDHDRQLVSSVWEGDVDEALCTSYIEGVWGDPAVSGYNELVDFRAIAAIDLPMTAIQRLAVRSRSVADPDAVSRSALVASEALIYGLSRMYVSMRDEDDSHRREWKVLDNIDEARRWLGCE